MQATTSHWMVVVEIGPLVLKKYVDNSWMAVPASVLEWSPAALSFDVGVDVLLE
jgi:hypothetical protein